MQNYTTKNFLGLKTRTLKKDFEKTLITLVFFFFVFIAAALSFLGNDDNTIFRGPKIKLLLFSHAAKYPKYPHYYFWIVFFIMMLLHPTNQNVLSVYYYIDELKAVTLYIVYISLTGGVCM